MAQAAYEKKVMVSADDVEANYKLLPATSSSLVINGEALDDTKLGSDNGYRERQIGLLDWSVDCELNFETPNDAITIIRNAVLNRTKIWIRYLPTGDHDANGLKGQVVVPSLNLSGEVAALETMSVSFSSDGAIAAVA